MDWPPQTVTAAITGAVAGLVGCVFWKPWLALRRAREVERAVHSFRYQREMLEAKFFDLAGTLGKPRGLRWLECDWQNDVTFARDTQTRLLTAFVGVNIRFEAIEGGEMEGVAAVGNVRDAAAVFHYRKGRWGTGGRALFNMDPHEAVARLQGQFERVHVETPAQRG